MKADLHLHTTASDGVLEPQALAARAAQAGFSVIAITDHDNMNGIAPAQEAAKALGVRVIPGVELSCGAQKEIHILGYGFDPQDSALLAFCAQRRSEREARARKMVRRLEELGRPVSLERVQALARGVMGRPHIARALVEAGHAASVSDAFERFLSPGRPAYVPREDVRVADAVRLIAQAGGVAVLAHPMELKLGEAALASLVGEWKAQGLAGLEVYHPSAQNNHAAFLERLARWEGLLVTGGSDYHGESMRRSCLGEGMDRWTAAASDVQALLERIAAAQEGRMHGCRP